VANPSTPSRRGDQEVRRGANPDRSEGFDPGSAKKVVIAYEPIWAIGTGKSASKDIAEDTIGFIRRTLRESFGNVAMDMRILYGGSVKPENVAEYMSAEDIDRRPSKVGGLASSWIPVLMVFKGAHRRNASNKISKVDLSPLAFIGIALAIGLLMVSLFWGIYMAVAGYQTYYLYYYLGSMGLIVVMMLFVAFDVNRMVAIAQKGMATTNTALYCAFQLYGDFIVLFIRILYLLLATQSRK
jgi:hypothetical protein